MCVCLCVLVCNLCESVGVPDVMHTIRVIPPEPIRVKQDFCLSVAVRGEEGSE